MCNCQCATTPNSHRLPNRNNLRSWLQMQEILSPSLLAWPGTSRICFCHRFSATPALSSTRLDPARLGSAQLHGSGAAIQTRRAGRGGYFGSFQTADARLATTGTEVGWLELKLSDWSLGRTGAMEERRVRDRFQPKGKCLFESKQC